MPISITISSSAAKQEKKLQILKIFTMPANTIYTFSTSKDDLDVVRKTLPLVAQAGQSFTKSFYTMLFKAHPELRNLFNQTNQAKGNQPQKLMATVTLAAQAAVETGVLPGEAIEGICQKHVALGIPKEAYDVVGTYILQTIRDLLTEDETVLKAWGSLYQDIATVFTTREAEIAAETATTPGGWLGRRKFVLKAKEEVSSIITRFTFSPVDEGSVPTLVPGKFTTVWVPVEGDGPHGRYTEQPRHYTLAAPRGGTDEDMHCLSISVKLDGIASKVLHESPLDSEWELSAPYGCFVISGVEKLWLTVPDAPVVFLSAGVGITPVLAMLENIYKTRAVTWLHGAKNGHVHAYRERLRHVAGVRSGTLQRRVWYSEPLPEDGSPATEEEHPIDRANSSSPSSSSLNTAKYHFHGRMDLLRSGKLIESGILHLNTPSANFFLCGPEAFMSAQRAALVNLGVSEDRIHSEGF